MKDIVFVIYCYKRIMYRGWRKKIINEIDIIVCVCVWGGGGVDLGRGCRFREEWWKWYV